jgi:hypothetical protein
VISNSFRHLIRDTPGVRYIGRALQRTQFAVMDVMLPGIMRTLSWLFTSCETTNLTYDLEDMNRQFLAAFVAHVCSTPRDQVLAYFDEVTRDENLLQHYRDTRRGSRFAFITDPDIRLGRRLVWYAAVRIMKPRVVVETGVDKGLGSLILCAALFRNAAEGSPGRYYGTDIKPDAGYLLGGRYADFGTILYGDSITSLEKLPEVIDLFISDSDHDPGYEAREYDTIAPKLATNFLVVSDQGTSALMDAADRHGWNFLPFRERAVHSVLDGADFGVAYPPSREPRG